MSFASYPRDGTVWMALAALCLALDASAVPFLPTDDAQVLEQHLRLQHVLEALLDPVQRVVQGRPEQRGARQGGLDVLQHVLVALRHPAPSRPPPDLDVFGENIRVWMLEGRREKEITGDRANPVVFPVPLQQGLTEGEKRIVGKAIVSRMIPSFSCSKNHVMASLTAFPQPRFCAR